ncbi:MAG: thermonuclease family protein [Leifsonia sp.]
MTSGRIWIYEATVIRPVDGDTTVMDIDQGMNHWGRNQYIRFAGINAPETRGATKPAGDAATAHLMGLIPVASKVWLATVEYDEFEKYGRVLAVVYTAPPTSLNWADAQLADLLPGSVNQEMIDSGNAIFYEPA